MLLKLLKKMTVRIFFSSLLKNLLFMILNFSVAYKRNLSLTKEEISYWKAKKKAEGEHLSDVISSPSGSTQVCLSLS